MMYVVIVIIIYIVRVCILSLPEIREKIKNNNRAQQSKAHAHAHSLPNLSHFYNNKEKRKNQTQLFLTLFYNHTTPFTKQHNQRTELRICYITKIIITQCVSILDFAHAFLHKEHE